MKIENNYLIFEPNDKVKIKPRKITGHPFVELIGLNKFTKVGDALVYMFKILKKQVDEKYLKRGTYAEAIVKVWLEKQGYECVTYDAEKINYNNFDDGYDFGGVIDIEIPSCQTLVEVKSKSMKSYSFIERQKPLDEVYQGMLYAYLRGYATFKMIWIFFDELTENEIFNGLKPTTLKNIKKIEEEYVVDNGDMVQKMYEAKSIVDKFIETKKISLNDLSQECLDELKAKYGLSSTLGEKEITFEDMGF